MNHEIEDILKRQPLRGPKPALDDRVLSALRADVGGKIRKADPSAGWRIVVGWGLAAAAAVAVVAFVLHRGQGNATPGAPIAAESAPQPPAPERPTVAAAGTSVQPGVPGSGDRVNAELPTGTVARSSPGVAGGPARAAVVAMGARRLAVVETTWSDWGAGSVMVLDGNLPVQPVVHRTVRYTRWTDPERNLRIERREPASQVFLVKAPVI